MSLNAHLAFSLFSGMPVLMALEYSQGYLFARNLIKNKQTKKKERSPNTAKFWKGAHF